jgi:hypothetical protein
MGKLFKIRSICRISFDNKIKRGAMVVMIAAGQGAMLWIGLLKKANKTRQQTCSTQGLQQCREKRPLTWVLYETQIKQGVLAWSIGQASRESQLDSSVEQ